MKLLRYFPIKRPRTKAQLHARFRGSFTVEAAFTVPLFVFAAVVILGLFLLMQAQIQVAAGLQYASRSVAASFCEKPEPDQKKIPAAERARAEWLFRKYLRDHDFDTGMIKNGSLGISLLGSDLSGEYVTLKASYKVKLPISFWSVRNLPVTQSVCCRKWIGAVPEGTDEGDDEIVYVTKTGSAYHKSTSCHYLDLSIRSIAADTVGAARNKSGGKYYRCGCFKTGQATAYVTDYGTQYHGDLNCRDLKRTVYSIKKSEVGGRHPCSKCYGSTEK